MQIETLVGALQQQIFVKEKGVFFVGSEEQEVFLSYSELYQFACQALHGLQEQGVCPGNELVFQIENEKSFLVIFWACLLGGIIPVPVTLAVKEEHSRKLFKIWPVLNHPFLLTDEAHFEKLEAFARQNDYNIICEEMGTRHVLTESLSDTGGEGALHPLKADDIAFIQFSSGSTGTPKGVVLTHANLLANLQDIGKAAKYSSADSMLSWMPLTHDMGLIGFHLNPLFYGMNHYLMPPALFVRKPALWLSKASEHQVSILSSPNFGYHHTLKYTEPAQRAQWDLSSVRILYNGAEPISAPLCQKFLSEFSTCNLRPSTMCPVYGLAEASLAVTISEPESEIISLHVDRTDLGVGRPVFKRATAGKGTITFLNVGKPIDHCNLRIVDAADQLLPEGFIGHVQIKGKNVTKGYYNHPDATQKAFRAGQWLDTGDLGFIESDCFYVTGRAKDIIFVNGQNYYPQDIEQLVEKLPGLELNKVAFAGYFNPEAEKEDILCFVVHRSSPEDFLALSKLISERVSSTLGLTVDLIIPVRQIPKTTSGKLQRFKLLQDYQSGIFQQIVQRLKELDEKTKQTIPGEKPATPLEGQILESWKKALKNDHIDVATDFLAIGGSSLQAAAICIELAKTLHIELAPQKIYECLTVRALAAVVAHLPTGDYLPIIPSAGKTAGPAAFAQKRLYYHWEVAPDSTAYNLPMAFRLNAQVDLKRLAVCLRRLTSRHDILNSRFERVGPEVELHIAEAVDIPLDYMNCREEDLDVRLRELVQPFDLQSGPLCRACLLETDKGPFVLFLDFHHAVSDGLSVAAFRQELIDLYEGRPLSPLPNSYKDFCLWEKEEKHIQKIKTQESYWLTKLMGPLPELHLPYDYVRPDVFQYSGAKVSIELDAAMRTRLSALAGQKQSTMHTLLFTIYKVLLHKYTGQDDILIGVPVSGRSHPALEGIHGMFVNNLVIRKPLAGEQSFLQTLAGEKVNLLEAYAHDEYPFYLLADHCSSGRKAGRNPIFDTMFMYYDFGPSRSVAESLGLSPYFFDPGSSKFDLSLEIFDEGDHLLCRFEYATDLFKKDTITRLAQHFQQLTNSILENPDLKVQDIPLFSPAEYDLYTYKFNATDSAYPADATIHQLFEEQAAKTPDCVALEFENNTWTYRELELQANQLARYLQRQGLKPGSIAAVWLSRSPELIISLLAILKAGGSYIPIDADMPVDRIAYILEHSCSQLIISDAARFSQYQDLFNIHRIAIDACSWEHESTVLPEAPRNPGQLAYTIYTSGTTGRPKGVSIRHCSLVNYIDWARRQYLEEMAMSFPLFTSISFDLTITSIFTPLISGGSIVIYKEDNPALLLQRILNENKVNIIKLTPSHLKLLKDYPEAGPTENSRLRAFIVGGEAFEQVLASEIDSRFGGAVKLYNEYGPTEATVGCMIHQFQPLEEGTSVPIGVPAANTQIYLLDRNLHPVPEGITGELYISGISLATGYLNDPALTDEKFIDNPFRPRQLMYRTGDLARRLVNGDLQYIGRADQQVKINGYRVELAEIERQLVGYHAVVDAVVMTPKDQPNILYAYYRTYPKSEGMINPELLRAYLSDKLPHYMIPVQYIRVDEIPLTANGKIDYQALPAPAATMLKAEKSLPENEVEAQLCQVWNDLFNRKDIGTNDNFFELGGDSIKAVQTTARLRALGISLQVKDVVTHLTIRHIARHACRSGHNRQYRQDAVSGEKAFSPIEHWFFEQRMSRPEYYNQTVLLELHREIDPSILEHTFHKLIEHHDTFRINLHRSGDRLYYNSLHIGKNFKVERFHINEDITPDLGLAALRNLKNKFDLYDGLLLNAGIIYQQGQSRYLCITAHHLLADGFSWRVLLEDLYLTYQALEHGEEVVLQQKTASLLDWQRSLEEYGQGGVSETQNEFWAQCRQQSYLPQDYEYDDWKMADQEQLHGVLCREQTLFLLQGANKSYNTDVPILLNTALAMSLETWTGKRRFVVEQETHGRHIDLVDTSRTIGWFTSMYPLQLCLEGEGISDYIKFVKEQIRNIPDKGIGYGIWKYLSKASVVRTENIIDLRFNYLGQFGREMDNELFRYSRLSTGPDSAPGNPMTAKITFDLFIIDDSLQVEISYSRKAHAKATMQQLLKNFFKNLEQILDHIRGENSVHLTPTDFDTVRLDQEDLNALFL